MPQIDPPDPRVPVDAIPRHNFTIHQPPEYSDWKCYLFGMGGPDTNGGMIFRPLKGNEPNAWWRFWQRFFLGNRWVLDTPTDIDA